MGARRVRPGTTKVSGLTPDQVRVLRDAMHQLLGAGNVILTPTTATFSCGPATAAEAVRAAIITRKQNREETRPLFAVERKLVKQVRPGDKAQPVVTVPKARRTRKPTECPHGDTAQLGDTTRAKCLDCGLIIDVAPVKASKPRQRPARPGQGGVTTAQVIPAASKPPARQKPAQPRYVAVWGMVDAEVCRAALVVDLEASRVIATCDNLDDARLIAGKLSQP